MTAQNQNDNVDLDVIMNETASGPKQIQNNAGMVTQQSISDLIALDKYQAAKKAANKKGLGIKLFRMNPGDTIGR